MFPFLFPLFADTVVAEYDMDIVYVHEWGVVEYQQGSLQATGARWGYLDCDATLRDYVPDMAEAPVVWFHGQPFTGDFSVEVQGGMVTTVLPRPDTDMVETLDPPPFLDRLEPQIHGVIWEELSCAYELVLPAEEEVPAEGQAPYYNDFFYDIPFQWAMPYWRQSPSMRIARESDGWSDSFLYYECTIDPTFDPLLAFETAIRASGEGMLFSLADGDLRAAVVGLQEDEIDILREGLSVEDILVTLCEWGGNRFKSEEIDALWKTWEPCIRTRCISGDEEILLFPLSPGAVESISTLHLETDQGYDVVYERLFLGLAAV